MENFSPLKSNPLLLHEHKEDKKVLTRSTSKHILGGVCGGLAKFAKTDPILFRVIFIVTTLIGGIGIFIYLTLLLALEPESFKTNEIYILRKEQERNFKVIIGSVLVLISLFEFLDFFTFFTGINLYFFNNLIALSLFLIFMGIVIFIKRNNFNIVNIYSIDTFYRIKKNKSFFGVCSGLAEYFFFNINSIRIVWILFTFTTIGFGAIVYMLIVLTSNYKEDSQIIEEI